MTVETKVIETDHGNRILGFVAGAAIAWACFAAGLILGLSL